MIGSSFGQSQDVHIEVHVYTIIAGLTCTCVLIPLGNICDLFYFQENVDTDIFFIIVLQKTAKIMFESSKHKKFSRFSNSITHIYINTFGFHYYKGKQNTNCLVILTQISVYEILGNIKTQCKFKYAM